MAYNPWEDDSHKKGNRNTSEKTNRNWKEFRWNFFDIKVGHTTIKILLIGIVCLYALSGFRQIQADEAGVVLRFGKKHRMIYPGLCYVLPWPFEEALVRQITKVHQMDVGVKQRNRADYNLVLTKDGLVNISCVVQWKIREDGLEDYLFNARSPEATVKAAFESVLREIVGQSEFMYVNAEGRADIQRMVHSKLQAVLDEYNVGVHIESVGLQDPQPPASVVDSFRDVEKAKEDQRKQINQAEGYSRDRRARTIGRVAEITNEAEAMAQSIVKKAEADVASFEAMYKEYKVAPDVVSKEMYLSAMEEILQDAQKVIVDKNVKLVSHAALDKMVGGAS